MPKVERLDPRGIADELLCIGCHSFPASGKQFPLFREINVTFLSTGKEKPFHLFGNRLSRKCA
jgi:hypothetical protein